MAIEAGMAGVTPDAVGVYGKARWEDIGGVNPDSTELPDVAKLGCNLTVAISGRALARFLDGIVMIKTGVGRRAKIGKDEYGTQTGSQATAGDTVLSTILTAGDKPVKIGQKIGNVWGRQHRDVLMAYCKEAGINPSRLLGLLWDFSHLDTMVCPIGVNESCAVDGPQGPAIEGARVIRWARDKDTDELRCTILFGRSMYAVTYDITEYCQKFTPGRLSMAGGTRTAKVKQLLRTTEQGLIKPIELRKGFGNSLIVDGSYVYSQFHGTVHVVGIWGQNGITWELTEEMQDKMRGSTKPMDSVNMVSEGSPYFEHYKVIKPCVSAIKQVRHLIAPYMSVAPHTVDIGNLE